MGKISAIDIKKLWYADEIKDALTPATLKTLLTTAKEVENVHQDTWQIEEGEASQDSYRNQLTGRVYRLGKRQAGELTVNFTIGQYDYETKAALMGGSMLDENGAVTETAKNAVGWARGDVQEIYKTIVALTVDDVYLTVSRSSMGTREASTDGAIGLAVSGTMTDSLYSGVASEYWYDKATVDKAGA